MEKLLLIVLASVLIGPQVADKFIPFQTLKQKLGLDYGFLQRKNRQLNYLNPVDLLRKILNCTLCSTFWTAVSLWYLPESIFSVVIYPLAAGGVIYILERNGLI